MLLDPLATIAASAVSFQNNLAGLDRVLDVLEIEDELETHSGAVTLPTEKVSGSLLIRDVSFRYPESDTMVLQDINLEVHAGETVALVGRSGAGKTTLTNLIARFYDASSGTICLDGRDLRDIKLNSYRSLLGIVEQDVFLFDGTIRENIAYAKRKREHHASGRGRKGSGGRPVSSISFQMGMIPSSENEVSNYLAVKDNESRLQERSWLIPESSYLTKQQATSTARVNG